MAGPSQQLEPAELVSPQDRLPDVVELYASNGSFKQTADALGLHREQVRRIIKSPQGSFALEQLLRDRARTRALRLGSVVDLTLDQVFLTLDRGCERILNSRRDGDPLTLFLRPDLRDLTGVLAWASQHLKDVHDALSVIDVTSHDVSHEARSHNLDALRELVALEERRLKLDGERAAQDAPVVEPLKQTPWSRDSFGGVKSTDPDRITHRMRAPSGSHNGVTAPQHGSSAPDAAPVPAVSRSSSAADAVAALTHDSDSSAPTTEPPSRDRPSPGAPARETATESFRDIGSSSEVVDWDDLE